MADKKGKVKFVRVRGRIIPIRQKVANSLDSASSITAGGATASLAVANTAAMRFRSKRNRIMFRQVSTVAKMTVLRDPIKAAKFKKTAMKASFKFSKLNIGLLSLSGALSLGSLLIAPDVKLKQLKGGE